MKPLNFGQYQTMKRFTFNQMNQWVLSVYSTGFVDGQESNQEFQCLNFDDETMYQFLMSIDGVSEELAKKIVQAMIQKGEQSIWELER